MSEQAGRYPRSAGGMVGAMIVLVAVVLGYVGLRALTTDEPVRRAPTVDYLRDAEYARDQAGFDLLAPQRLPEGWRATSVRYVSGGAERWHIGFLTDEDRYVGLEQADSTVATLVETHVDADAREGRPVRIEGRRWTTWSDEGGDLALVRQHERTTTLVVGDGVDLADLVGFVASLR